MQIVPISPFWRRLLPAAVLALLTAAGCHAQPISQTAPAVQAGVPLSAEMTRRIEVMIRNNSSLSADATLAIGVPVASDLAGFDVVTITVNGNTSKPTPFYISTDGNTLAQIKKFDMGGDLRHAVSDAGRPSRGGDEHAPVLIVVFDDLECPYCAQMHNDLMPAILARYKDQVRVVYRDFPLPQDQHPWAMHAAVDANCLAAGSATAYWNYVDKVHGHAGQMGADARNLAASEKQLDKLALDEGAQEGVNQAELVACVLKQDTAKIQASVEAGEADPLRVGSTPVLFINGEKVDGIVPIGTLYQIIDRALIAEGKTPPAPAAAVEPAQSGSGASQPPAAPAQPKPGS